MNKFQASIFIYALINIAMGLHGLLGAGSKISMIAGGAVGLLEIFFGTLSKSNPRVGYIGAAVVSLLTAGNWMGLLFNKDTHQLVIYPALTGLILSAALTLFLVGGHLMGKKKAKGTEPKPDTAK